MFHGSVNIVKKSSDRTTPARYRTDTRRRRNRQGHASRGETEVVEPTITITPSPVTSRTRATRLRLAPGPADPTHNPINTDGESHARLPALLFGFSLNHRSTNTMVHGFGRLGRSWWSSACEYFSLCAPRQSSTKSTGALNTSANSRQPTTGRTAHWSQAIVRTDRCPSRSTKGPRSTR
jgi:hypothetical protein